MTSMNISTTGKATPAARRRREGARRVMAALTSQSDRVQVIADREHAFEAGIDEAVVGGQAHHVAAAIAVRAHGAGLVFLPGVLDGAHDEAHADRRDPLPGPAA